MVNILLAVIAVGGILGVVTVVMLLSQVRRALDARDQNPAFVASQPVPREEPPPRPLEGLRVAVAITQDHPHAVFVDVLKDQLFAEDVTDILVLSAEEAALLDKNWKDRKDAPDILIKGDIVCNGYAEIYYTADFICSNATDAICTLIEKPPHGDRPSNLAIELVARLKKELGKIVGRNERRQAIRELKGS
jgi:hypothetical protein